MALSFKNVQNAYTVFNEIQKTVLPELSISTFPEDMAKWSDSEKENPKVNQVYGYGRKSDSGWENIVFFAENPSQELMDKFNELKDKVDNSSICKPYSKNNSLWIFGWF